MNVQVDVQTACDDDTIPEATTVDAWVTRAIEAAGTANDVEVSVRIVSADEIQALNHDYRDKDKATNVLSFPAGPLAGLPDDAPALLGDIVICASVVDSEAAEQGKTIGNHWAHMLVHGVLHLLGYDHINKKDATIMEALEVKILSKLNYQNPYMELTHE